MINDDFLLSNARLLLPGAVTHGCLRVRDGRVAGLDAGPTSAPGAIDLEGDYLLPGLVDVHTDNLERQMTPRPAVLWPQALPALLAHDAQVVAAGVTTALDGVFVGEYHEGGFRRRMFNLTMDALDLAADQNLLKARHLLHLRCEYSDPHVLELLEPHVDNPSFRLASLMDHTPGQRQFDTNEKFRSFYRSRNWTDEEFHQVVEELKSSQERNAAAHREAIVGICAARGIPLATHDDSTVEHVDQALAEGVAICEFPTTATAAAHAHAKGQKVVLGAPNVVLGGSHTGNVSARELARAGHLDILASDYVPGGMLHAVFLLHQELGMPLPEALACVTDTPARALGLDDRGRLEEGLLADLVRVRLVEGLPVVLGVWVEGRQVF